MSRNGASNVGEAPFEQVCFLLEEHISTGEFARGRPLKNGLLG
jgi:hypothetical protein